ncbi:MAG: RHS repeat-associated core domain-containing protein [Enterobacterales bacterium]|nr:RHS repeat-associated core domain-containing protein [Enterobacterales bacterium]
MLGSEATNRGFTDHEHLDDAQLIHMNGRVYDYNLGRFLSVDPFIQAPGNSQSMNPYSYIMNNPLAGTDPSGYAADIDQDKLEVKVTSQSRTRSAPTGSRIKRDTSRTITATVTDESGKSSNYVYTVARNGSERAFKITPKTLKLDNTDLGSKGQVGVGTNGDKGEVSVEGSAGIRNRGPQKVRHNFVTQTGEGMGWDDPNDAVKAFYLANEALYQSAKKNKEILGWLIQGSDKKYYFTDAVRVRDEYKFVGSIFDADGNKLGSQISLRGPVKGVSKIIDRQKSEDIFLESRFF